MLELRELLTESESCLKVKEFNNYFNFFKLIINKKN